MFQQIFFLTLCWQSEPPVRPVWLKTRREERCWKQLTGPDDIPACFSSSLVLCGGYRKPGGTNLASHWFDPVYQQQQPRGNTEMSAPLSVNVLISVHLDREEAKRTRLSPSLLCSLLQADSIIGRVFIYAYIKYIHNFSFKFNLIFLVFSLQFYCLTWTSEMKHVSVQAQPLYPQCTSVSLLPLHTQRLQRCVSTC